MSSQKPLKKTKNNNVILKDVYDYVITVIEFTTTVHYVFRSIVAHQSFRLQPCSVKYT